MWEIQRRTSISRKVPSHLFKVRGAVVHLSFDDDPDGVLGVVLFDLGHGELLGVRVVAGGLGSGLGFLLRRAKRVAMEGASVTLEMAKNLAAAPLHMEVSSMYVNIHYTRLFSSSLCSSHTLTCLASSSSFASSMSAMRP